MEREDSPDWLHEYKGPATLALDPLSDSSPSDSPSRSKRDEGQNGASSLLEEMDAVEEKIQSAHVQLNDSDDEVPIKRFIVGSKAVNGKKLSAGSPGGSARKRKAAPGDENNDEASPMKVVKSKNKRVKQEITITEVKQEVMTTEEDAKPPSKSKGRQSKGFGIEGEKTASTAKKVVKGRQLKVKDEHMVETLSEDIVELTAGVDSKAMGGDSENEVVSEKITGAAALGASADDETFLTQDSTLQTEDVAGEDDAVEVQERRVKPKAASSLPLVFAEKIHRTKVLLECEGDALDLSGDMGAVGRFSVEYGDSDNSEDELLLDLKGIIYRTTIVPSNTFFVVNVGQTEAKVEAIMNDFVQLRADTDRNENETMVEGTLEGFTFDSDEEGERLAGAGAGKESTAGKDELQESDDDGKAAKLKKTPAKGPKAARAPAKKATAGKSKSGRGKASAKGGGAKKATRKAAKPKASKSASTAKKTK